MLEFYSSYNQNSLLFSIKRRRPSPYGSPQTTTVYGKTCTNCGASPNNSCLLISCGDCEAIEQKCLMSPKKHATKIIKYILNNFQKLFSFWYTC